MHVAGQTRQPMNSRGVALVEFALIGPLFILLVFIVLQLGMIGWAKSSLETVVRDAARFALTGQNGTKATREASLIDGIEQGMSMFQRQAGQPITVTTKVYPTFEDIAQPEKIVLDTNANGVCETGDQYQDYNMNGTYDTDMAKIGYGGPNDVVIYNVAFPMEALLPLNQGLFDLGQVFNLKASAAVQNEPFGAMIVAPVLVC
jgi:TadE-like protein